MNGECAIKECFSKHYCKSFCIKHYAAVRKYGDPLYHSKNKKHGMSKSPEFTAWVNLRARCEKVNHPSYKDYGGRGIEVCERWQKFENFFEDMGLRPSNEHSLDRTDNNGNYEPNNCRWATKKQQQANRRFSNSSGIRNVFKVKGCGYVVKKDNKYYGHFVDKEKARIIAETLVH